jgi:hypothetical protein
MRISVWLLVNLSLFIFSVINLYASKTNVHVNEIVTPLEIKDLKVLNTTQVEVEVSSKPYVEARVENATSNFGRRIYIITPTLPRIVQRPDLVRMIEYVRSAHKGGPVTWVVVDDSDKTSFWNEKLFNASGLPDIIYTFQKTPTNIKRNSRGVLQRNKGLRVIYDSICSQKYSNIMDYPIIYFADDDNTYDHRLWNLFRENVVRVAVLNVGLITSSAVPIEGPKIQIFNTTNATSLENWEKYKNLGCGVGDLSVQQKQEILNSREIMTRVTNWSSALLGKT